MALPEEPPTRRARHSHRMTIEGILYVGLTLLIGLAALNTGANLLYLVVSVMLALLIMSWMLSRINMRNISITRSYPLEFHAGQTVQGILQLHNGKRWFNSYAIRLHDAIIGPEGSKAAAASKPSWFSAYTLEARAGEHVNLPIEIHLPQRGLYVMREVRVVSRYPFGFKESIRRQAEQGKILVYPRLLPIISVLPHVAKALGEFSDDRKGQGASLYGVRDYQPGDSMRYIHWKLSAKGHGMKVKEFEQEESRSYLLMIDVRCPAKPSAELLADFEKALSLIATLARLLMSRGAQVGLWTTLGNVPPAMGGRHLQRIMRALAQLDPLPPDSRVVHPDSNAHEATQIWIEFQPTDNRAARAGSVVRRATGYHVLDARKIIGDGTGAVR